MNKKTVLPIYQSQIVHGSCKFKLMQYYCTIKPSTTTHVRFGGLCVDCRSNPPYWAAETTIHNNWGDFTIILSFNIDIIRYKSTILRLFDILIHFFIFRTCKQTRRLYGPCVGFPSHVTCRSPVVDSSPKFVAIISFRLSLSKFKWRLSSN